jgi:hypothetical protein
MRKSWLLCVLMGTLAWGQAQPGMTPAQPSPAQAPAAAGKAPENAAQAPAAAAKAPERPAPEVAENVAVITITGVCPTPKTAAGAKTASGKTAAAKKPADCKTIITRAQFEKIAKALQQGPNPLNAQQKRQLANVLPKVMAMSKAAEAKGLDKTPQFAETMKFVRMQILTTQLQHQVQQDAEKISATQIDDYYKANPEAYQQFSLDRLFVPRNKQVEPEKEDAKAEKLTDEQQKAKEAADKAKQEEGEQELSKLADSLRERAAAGEDFIKLQKEAFEAAGMKNDSPTVNLPKVRRTGLPPAHAAVFDLKVGEVSAVISDNAGHYVYKVVSKEVLPLDKVTDEIRNTLKSQATKDAMEKYNNSYHAETNDAYFGPPGPAGPMGARPGAPRVPHPRMPPPPQPQGQPQAAPPAANPPAEPPAQQAPPSKPN